MIRIFYGGVLHISYAPEFESIQETRDKLHDRRRTIAWRKRKLGNCETLSRCNATIIWHKHAEMQGFQIY